MKWSNLLVVLVAGLLLSGCTFFDKPKPAGLQIVTTDQAASVFIDGQYLEKSPLIEKNLKPGEYLIKIEPDDNALAHYETPVTLKAGVITVLTWKAGPTAEMSGGVLYEMETLKDRSASEITFVTIPDGVIISFDGGEKQIAPISITNVEPGQHTFEAGLPSFESQKHTINALAGQRMIVTIKLAKNDLLPTATPQPSPTETPAANEKSELSETVTIIKTNFFRNGVQVLRIRALPNSESEEIGWAEVGKSYPVLDRDPSGWLKISFDQETTGWVSEKYTISP